MDLIAGEDLKDLRKFPARMEKILKVSAGVPNRRLRVMIVGGGSLGDFGGFVASILKRGVPVVQVPSTWLAAIDSAHGGKTGLNALGLKNQLGTIHPPEEVWLIEPLLKNQNEERAEEALGELLKIGLLEGAAFWKKLPKKTGGLSHVVWSLLPNTIAGKMKVVRRDPFEKSGIRHLLNLGHTMGHVFEAEKKIPHGRAVGFGLIFALVYSRHRGFLKDRDFDTIVRQKLWTYFAPDQTYLELLSIPEARIRRALSQDKKSSAKGKVRFIYLNGLGRPRILETPVDDIVTEARRQRGLLRGLYA